MRQTRPGFTLIELLVVVAIIALLIAILLPALGRARFVARVAVCASQFRQGAIANLSYAQDNGACFPRHDITWMGVGRNAWDMNVNTPRAWAEHGYDFTLWHCPVRAVPYEFENTEKAIDAFRYQKNLSNDFCVIPIMNWVPRRDKGAWIVNSGIDGLGQPNAWPTRVGHPMIARYPILSDYMASHPTINPNPYDPKLAGGGHPYNGVCESTNAAYGDGHVETHQSGYDEVRYVRPHYINWF